MKSRKSSLLAGSVIVGMLVSMLTISSAYTTDEINLDKSCMTIDQSRTVSTFHKVPNTLPEGYSVKCVAVSNPYEVSMVISDKSVLKDWESDTHKTAASGAIYLYQVDERNFVGFEEFQTYGSPEERIQSTIKDINEKNPTLNPKFLTINGMPAYGIEACSNCGIQTAEFADGTTIESSYDVPAKLKIIDNEGVKYSFYANIPLNDLIEVAKSLQ